MSDTDIPKPVGGEDVTAPVQLGQKMTKLCAHLDALYTQNGRSGLPSDMIRGAVFVARTELRKNTDWLAQAAHSLRDTLYPFLSPKAGGGQRTTKALLKKFGSAKDPEHTVPRMGRLFGELTAVAHHGSITSRSFEDMLADFEEVLADALGRQSDIHGEIDDLLAQDPTV